MVLPLLWPLSSKLHCLDSILAFNFPPFFIRASLVAQTVKNLPAKQETWVQSLGWEDALEKGMATHSSIRAWRIPWTEEPGRLQSMGLKKSHMTEQLSLSVNIMKKKQTHRYREQVSGYPVGKGQGSVSG